LNQSNASLTLEVKQGLYTAQLVILTAAVMTLLSPKGSGHVSFVTTADTIEMETIARRAIKLCILEDI